MRKAWATLLFLFGWNLEETSVLERGSTAGYPTYCSSRLGGGKVGAVPNAEHIWVFLMLQSLFVHVHPASRICHRTGLEDIWGAHRWCDMKHFILYKTKTSQLSSIQCLYGPQALLCPLHFLHHNSCREHCALGIIPIHRLSKTLCATVEDDENLNSCPQRVIQSASTEPMSLQQKGWGNPVF